jgi:hypothetical protein
MRLLVCLFALACGYAGVSSALAQPAPVTLDRLVSIERQRSLGLDKLNAEQRAGVVRLRRASPNFAALRGLVLVIFDVLGGASGQGGGKLRAVASGA